VFVTHAGVMPNTFHAISAFAVGAGGAPPRTRRRADRQGRTGCHRTCTVHVTVTDNEGCSTRRVFTGQLTTCNGPAAASAARTLVVT
jgi:hypothetical protein